MFQHKEQRTTNNNNNERKGKARDHKKARVPFKCSRSAKLELLLLKPLKDHGPPIHIHQSHMVQCEAATPAGVPRTWPLSHTRRGARCRAPSPRTDSCTTGILPAGARTSPCLPCRRRPHHKERYEMVGGGGKESIAAQNERRAARAFARKLQQHVVWRARRCIVNLVFVSKNL